jgi:N6-adenosine-specific RNA methylase IME4
MDYKTMSLEEIKNFDLNRFMEKDCNVFLWVTHKYLPFGLELFKKWNVTYHCLLTWVKNVGFTPFSFMFSTELVLFGHHGKMQLTEIGKRIDFKAPVTRHSEKPDVFYELVRDVSAEPRIDIFARKQHYGFVPYGNEIQAFVQLPMLTTAALDGTEPTSKTPKVL